MDLLMVEKTQAFIASMRREWFKMNPSVSMDLCPIKDLGSYPLAQKLALVRSIDIAVKQGAAK